MGRSPRLHLGSFRAEAPIHRHAAVDSNEGTRMRFVSRVGTPALSTTPRT